MPSLEGEEVSETREHYNTIRAMNPSTLVHGCHSMKRLKRMIDAGGFEPTDPMRLGTGIHALLLEPEEFEAKFVVEPDFHLEEGNKTATGKQSDSRATGYVKQRLSEFASQNKDRVFLTRNQYDAALTAIESLRERQHLVEIIDRCQKEITLRGKILGHDCKGRVDLLDVDRGEIVDLKTTACCERYNFGRQFANLHIAFKMAMYRELAQQQFGRRFQCSLITQETGGDFDNAYVPIPDIVLDNAWNKVRDVMERYQGCLQTGVWNGVDGGALVYDLHVPNWAMEDSSDLDWGNFETENEEVAF